MLNESLETLQDYESKISSSKVDIATAIVAKGGTVNAGDGLMDFAEDIASITNQYTSSDEGKVVDNGELVAQTAVIYTANDTYDTTLINSVTVDVASDVSNVRLPLSGGVAKPCVKNKLVSNKWVTKTWSGLSSFRGDYIWTDGENIYCSDSSTNYVLDKETSTWTTKTWSGLSSFNGNKIWTDGNNIYYSNDSNQYALDKETSTWTTKIWTGLTSFRGDYIWTDGDNIYYSNSSTHYVLDKSTSTWTTKTWSGLSSFYGNRIWTDGNNIYSSGTATSGTSNCYTLNKSTSTWTTHTWSPSNNVDAAIIWSDGYHIYCGSNYIISPSKYVIGRYDWDGLTSFRGDYIWTDGDNIYYSNGSDQYVLDKDSYIIPNNINVPKGA